MNHHRVILLAGTLAVACSVDACASADVFFFGGTSTGTSGAAGSTNSGGGSAGSSATAGAGGDSTTSSGGSSTGGTGGSAGTGGVGGSSVVDCDNIPQGPFSYTVMWGPKATEDLAFDGQGRLVGAANGNLYKSLYGGQSGLWLGNAGGFISGLRALPGGDIMYADVDSGTLFRVDSTPQKTPVLSGLAYANGITVDLDGYVWVAEQNGGRVRRVDPDTGNFEVLADGLHNPNGVSFSPDYNTLYIGSFGGGSIHALSIDPPSTPDNVPLFIDDFTSTGSLDGMGVDACGNVYVCEYVEAKVWRISPDAQDVSLVVDLGGETSWIPNMQWGTGIGGWEKDHLFVLDISDEKLYEIPVGVPAKPRPFP